MPAKKKSATEVLPPESEARPPRRRVVAAKHTVTYEAPELVEIPEEVEDEDDPGRPEIELFEPEPPQARPPSFRMKLRERFQRRGIGVDETLHLRIDRLPHFDQNGLAGVRADKAFCGVIQCTEKFFEGDEYLIELQRRYGPGQYWLTVRHKNAVVSSWREEVGGLQVAPVTVQANEPGQSATVFYQNPQAQTQISPAKSIKDEMKEVAEIIRMVDTIRGPREETAAPAPSMTDPDTILLSSLASNDKFMEKITNGLVGKIIGNKGGADDDPSPWSVAMELVKSGQASTIVQTVISSFFNGINSMIPGRQNQNGQTQMAQAPLPQTYMGNPQHPQQPHDQIPWQGPQAQPQGPPSVVEVGAHAPGQLAPPSPEQDALNLLIDHCKRKMAPKITYAELTNREQRLDLLLNQHAAQTGQILSNQISIYLDVFADMPADDAISFVNGLPNGAEVSSLPHAKEWVEQLQTVIRDSQEGDEA